MRPIALTSAVVLLDQLAKLLVRRTFLLGDAVTVIPTVFDLRYVQNTGAAWGMMSGMMIVLIAFSVAMLAAIVVFRKKIFGDHPLSPWCLGLLCGGIIGNLIDRVRLGYVVDFLDFHWGIHHFPTFNVADSAICIGAGLFILLSWLNDKSAKANGSKPSAARAE